MIDEDKISLVSSMPYINQMRKPFQKKKSVIFHKYSLNLKRIQLLAQH